MHLKRIEIIGFKSFADKTKLVFEPGVTGIVGPNGSGKSNITEAIRWVLGETSAKSLRGGKMPDIIFAGSQTRKALNIAEVTVILDNQDNYLPLSFTEIAVTRRLNRNGDSDYFINKKRSRLRDIQELFMDSGLGKESFSIISQGKVEAIFNSKPEDRRGIFEEAAGVFKYKQKKHAAEQKLFETEDNLNRVNDIIYELQEQLAPLAAESKKAQEHLRFKEELKTVEVAVTAARITQWKVAWEQTKAILQELAAKLEIARRKAHQLNEELLSRKAQHQRVDAELAKAQEQLVVVTRSYEQHQSKQELLKQASATQAAKKAELEEALSQSAATITQLTTQKETLAQQLLSNQSALDELASAVEQQKELVQQYSRSVKEQLADLRAEYIEIMQAETNFQNDGKHANRQQEQAASRMKRQQERLDQFNVELQQLAEQLTTVTEKQTMAQDKLAKMKELASKKQDQFNQLQQNYEALQKEYYNHLGTLQQRQARLKSLAEIAESHAGYYQGVRGILRNKQLTGIHGAVAELMTVPAKLTQAIETALGASMQNVVVENERSAQQAIEFLKQQRLGRATFLPLTTIKRRTLPNYVLTDLQQQTGFVGVASDLVSYEERYQEIYGSFLGTTLIAENLDAAIAIAKKVRHQYKVVSLVGDVMNAGGSMTGGANASQKAGLLTQAQEQERLKAEVAQLTQLTTTAENSVRASQETQNKLQGELQLLREKEEQGRAFLQKQENSRLQLTSQQEQIVKEAAVLTLELKNAQAELTEYQDELTQVAQKRQEMSQQKEKIQEQMTQLESAGNANETLKAAAQDKLNQVEKDLALMEQAQAHLRAQSSQTASDLTSALAQQTRLQAQLTAEFGDAPEISPEDLAQRIKELHAKQQALTTSIASHQSTKENLAQQIDELAQALKVEEDQERAVLSEQGKQEGESSRLETRLDNSLVFLQEEYEMTYEKAQAEFPLTTSLEEGTNDIRRIKGQLQTLGPVNLGAIEQYQQVNERYEFLTTQRDDLLVAKEHLFATMREMDDEVKQRFQKTFEEIRREFQTVFPKMFGGGQAQLVLTDPHDLLNTGIEIEAQPPGKKLQSLNLLSGGERALTAITLLFAILQVRPVPFTVLDEVEAALDEANVTRFGNYLKTFEDTRQFIVVTHRKGTMVACDVLYGVTMEESGVSKVLSVKLKDIADNGEIKGEPA
ncbi:chromosome segregation protein SMC [Enterococcus nangangensis]